MGPLSMPSAAFSSSFSLWSYPVTVDDMETPHPTMATEMFMPCLAAKPWVGMTAIQGSWHPVVDLLLLC